MENLKNILTNKIKVSKEKLLKCSSTSVSDMVKSIKRNDGKILQPIIIDQNNVLIDGEVRLEAAKKLGFEYIECIVYEIQNDYERINIEVDSNLERRELNILQRGKLHSHRKKAYELQHPTSTKEFKSKNNALPENKRVEVEPRYEDDASQKLGISAKTIENEINTYENINEKSPELVDRLIKNENSTKNRVQKVELNELSKLSQEETLDVLENMKNNPPKQKGDLKKIIQKVKTVNEQEINEENLFHQVFLHDLSKFISNNKKFSSLKEKINVDITSVSEYKKSKKLDFTNEIKFILENIK